MGETDNDIVRVDERQKALSARVDEYRKDLKGDIDNLKSDLNAKISAVAANQRWVAIAVIMAVITQVMKNLLSAGGMQ